MTELHAKALVNIGHNFLLRCFFNGFSRYSGNSKSVDSHSCRKNYKLDFVEFHVYLSFLNVEHIHRRSANCFLKQYTATGRSIFLILNKYRRRERFAVL